MGIVWIGRNPVAVPSRLHLSGNPAATLSKHRATLKTTQRPAQRGPEPVRTTGKQPHGHCLDWDKPGRSAQPVAASRRNPFDSSSARLENRASWRTSRCNKNAPHGIGKPTANRDLTPPATANGYRPADGWGVVNQAWRPGKTGDSKQGRHHAKT